jgi:hypothetical protein
MGRGVKVGGFISSGELQPVRRTARINERVTKDLNILPIYRGIITYSYRAMLNWNAIPLINSPMMLIETFKIL